ncbi:haloalkane dehalogenase [Burkholderia sp. 22PA0106]|uniref:haloalkane dehalogenase n=1 Tax=Burkholderia sp. 22PA0106 TaxID=3237371 RepID=UPI0039C10C97
MRSRVDGADRAAFAGAAIALSILRPDYSHPGKENRHGSTSNEADRHSWLEDGLCRTWGRSGRRLSGVEDQARYFEAFVEALGVKDLVLVLHDWGSAIGLDWARRHQDRVRGLALMEFITPIPTWLDIDSPAREAFRAFRSDQGRKRLIDENRFIEQVLPGGVVRKLTEEEMEAYRQPFLDPASREPVYRFPNELPIAGAPVDVWAMVHAYIAWLHETDIPKLLFFADPGAFISPTRAAKLQAELRNCTSIPLGAGRHFVQEDHGELIGREIAKWLPTLKP